MQTNPTARHSPIGLSQRVCYLVHLVRDGRVAAARGTRPPALQPDRRRARRGGKPRMQSTRPGSGVSREGVRQSSLTKRGSSGRGPGHQTTRLVCPRPDRATWAGSPAASWPTAPSRARQAHGRPEATDALLSSATWRNERSYSRHGSSSALGDSPGAAWLRPSVRGPQPRGPRERAWGAGELEAALDTPWRALAIRHARLGDDAERHFQAPRGGAGANGVTDTGRQR
jgi:hypothetical protein